MISVLCRVGEDDVIYRAETTDGITQAMRIDPKMNPNALFIYLQFLALRLDQVKADGNIVFEVTHADDTD